MAEITYQDLVIDENDVYSKKILITGGTPTSWTDDNGRSYDYVNVTVSEPYYKEGAFGRGTSNYRYGTSADIVHFSAFKAPYYAESKMFMATDRNGKSVGIILDIDFSTVQEVEYTPRQKSKPMTPAQSAPNAPKA